MLTNSIIMSDQKSSPAIFKEITKTNLWDIMQL